MFSDVRMYLTLGGWIGIESFEDLVNKNIEDAGFTHKNGKTRLFVFEKRRFVGIANVRIFLTFIRLSFR